jgi:trehalose-phosphatase
MSTQGTVQGIRVAGSEVDAAIFDLDGVITQTARVHARAWKRMFDEYLRERSERRNEPFLPFSIAEDYPRYVDGKPRYDGVSSFLESRGIKLDYGTPEDPPGKETYCGLGNRKNKLFRDVIHAEGVDVYDDAVATIREWRRLNIKTAVVSSSKNCALIVRVAGLERLFDASVDGAEAEKLDIPGKPAPDLFTLAAKKLDVHPERALIVEDAIAGVQAGRAGGFALVVGVARKADRADLKKHGADVMVQKLTELTTEKPVAAACHPPSALEHFDALISCLDGKKAAVFLDYDGTLTPVVSDPDKAFMPQEMRAVVRRLADLTTVAIISGRDRPVVEDFVQIEGITYAGSHGFDIRGPDFHQEHQGGVEASGDLDKAQHALEKRLHPVAGVLVERKRFALAIHYRNVAAEDADRVEQAVHEVHKNYPKLRRRGGKKVFELQPDVDWNKGKALLWLLEILGMKHRGVRPLYIGDDVTDEDAFAVLTDSGIGIVVGDETLPSNARYWLRDPDAVGVFLERLGDYLYRRKQ